jgi:hypothetical protein
MSADWLQKIADLLQKTLVPVFRRRALQRLSSEIGTYKEELTCQSRCAHSLHVLEAAGAAVRAGEIDRGWRYLMTARRLEAAAGGDAERKAAAIAILKESDAKLGSWRKEAVRELLNVA